jgi:hypothetical protein
MTYIPILRAFINIKGHVSRFLRDFLFHAGLRLKHVRREWSNLRQKVLRAARDSFLAVAPIASRLKIPEPPVPHLLLSNEAPSDTEITLVRLAIQQAAEESLKLRAELFLRIAAGNRNLVWETLTRHKIACFSVFIEQQEGIVSPLRRLPPEILQHIFLFVVPTCTNIPRSWNLAIDVPWVLGQVSRLWRRSSLSYPPLWCCFPKLELRMTKSRTVMQLEMVEELLKRSGIAPLTIYVNSLPESYHLQSHPTLDLLTKSSERWVVAAFGLSVKLSRSLEIVKGRLPLLEKLFVHDHVEYGIRSLPFDTFKTAPKLRAVNTSAIHHMELPVEQLISCKIEISASHFLQQVLQCPRPCPLENLTILELLDPHSVVPVMFPRLVKLLARFWTSPDTSVLRKFTLPAIEHIQILCCESHVLLVNLIVMLSNCTDQESTLKRLWYRVPDHEEIGFSELLALVPSLIELDANLPTLGNIEHLIDGFMDRELVPLLDTCKFFVERDRVDAKMADALNRLAESRYELTIIDVKFPDEVRLLKSLLVYSEDRKAIQSLNGVMNGYNPTPAYEALISAGAQFPKAMKSACQSRRRAHTSELDTVLDAIERIDVQDVQDIYVCFISSLFDGLTMTHHSPSSLDYM